jgi:hypothetical protein
MVSTSKFAVYDTFVEALVRGDVEEMKGCICETFLATFYTDETVNIVDMNFSEFCREIERQRKAFPDFGQDVITSGTTEHDEAISVIHTMTMTFNGVLESVDGQSSSVGTGEEVTIIQAITIVFDENDKIQWLLTRSNLSATIEQMFPTE